ncbi:hypothetical protein Scep_002825 [Stephania cephalantha]|uniref:F-box domain-containing protein n=1 Tax=Stephania cephalantha TaxID=152367 RepID=A0AAP0Q686_9MAGN
MKKRSVAVHEDSICEDVIIGILSRLPGKSLFRFKSVCKAWRTLIDQPSFIQKHLEQSQRGEGTTRPNNIMFLDCNNESRLYSLDIESSSALLLSCDEVEVELTEKVRRCEDIPRLSMLPCFLGSCNGLVCIKASYKTLCLFNPCTRTYTNFEYKHPQNMLFSSFGFGYDAKIKDYKLVMISNSTQTTETTDSASNIKVLTLGTNAWRKLSNVPYRVGLGPGKLINGALHWIDNETNQVICFDVEEEEFKVVSRPVYYNAAARVSVSVEVAELEGCLAVVCRHRSRKCRDVEVWMMKEYGLEDSWTKMFSIDPKTLPPLLIKNKNTGVFRPKCFITALCILKNNEGVLLLIDRDIVLYNLKSNTCRYIHRVAIEFFSIVSYRGSLINLAQEFAE